MWFYTSEAVAIDDTLWSNVERRRRYAALYLLYMNSAADARQERAVSDSLASVVKQVGPTIASHSEGRRYAEDQLMLCKQRSKNKWWTGFGVGVGTLMVLGLTTALLVR